ncbi:glycosyltransferase family 4 protein [Nocardioides panacisoli]|uniref:glycosyltransferase family 4 protein n=1 Tax=Nocardioides panacisoli TaxID=627624 RepID=UPI001C63209F|nr:glycosyltransferase family 1 protein [Nocardioides panacisoli]QYJ03926.1 glycosyltransferase family 4 protein [Nocardioides panacisoli]
MHVLIDAVAVRTGSSAIVVEHLLRGWRTTAPEDRLTVLAAPDGPSFAVPEGVAVTRAHPPVSGPVGQLWLRTVAVRRAARDVGADAVLSGVPASGLLPTGRPRGVLLYDLRHELRPAQFSRGQRLARRLSWGWSLRRADGIFTISERTLTDLRTRHRAVAGRGVAAVLGSDHVTAWPPTQRADPPYALAFGHFANKNAHAVIEGWARFCRAEDTWRLRLVGMGSADRAAATRLVEDLDLGDRVELMPWLDDDAFREVFAGAGLVVFPSDFEGFGLPAAEALRLGIPVVVSADPALTEVTGGFAAVADSAAPDALATAMQDALARTPEQLAAGQAFAESFTWARTAATVRAGLLSP